MNILGPSTEEVPRQKFRDAVRRDINAVVGACLPTYIEFLSNVEEPKLVLGCLHPVDQLVIGYDMKVSCRVCNHTLDKELVGLRIDQARTNGQI